MHQLIQEINRLNKIIEEYECKQTMQIIAKVNESTYEETKKLNEQLAAKNQIIQQLESEN